MAKTEAITLRINPYELTLIEKEREQLAVLGKDATRSDAVRSLIVRASTVVSEAESGKIVNTK